MSFACVFPGQGSQHVGMLADVAAQSPLVHETFAEASQVLGYDLWDLCQQGPETSLNQTDKTQPALLTASVALWRVISAQSEQRPAFMAGHSLGEYSALVCAGVMGFTDAVKLVETRGQLMQQAVPKGTGAMYAIIGLDDEQVRQACATAQQDQVVSAVNYNSPGQVVIAGQAEAVERAAALCKEAGAKRALPLAVSVPSHCELMRPAADKLVEHLRKLTFNAAQIPVVNNVDVKVETDAKAVKDALVRQLYMPVRWTESVQWMAKQGVEKLVEVGPGRVLTGLAKRIDKSLSAEAANTPDSLQNVFAQ